MRANAYWQLGGVAARANGEDRTQGVDMHLPTGSAAGGTEPIAHLLVFRSERQPLHPTLRSGAELRGLMNGSPKPLRVDLQVGLVFGHCLLRQSSGVETIIVPLVMASLP